MNKSNVVDAIASKTGLSKKDTEAAVEALIDIITESLQKEEAVAFTGFGTFQISNRAARQGINPATKEKIQIPAMKVPKFKAGKNLRQVVRSL